MDSVRIWRNETINWASEGFRPKWHNGINNLADCHARHALDTGFIQSMPDMSKPWLTIEGDKKWEGRVVVNKSARYANHLFPWRAIVEHYGRRIVFLGMPEEHQSFCANYGHVEYHRTENMLEVAKIIAGSSLLIANQSSCMTIAEGLKHPRIQESCLHLPDCIYPESHNAQYCGLGDVLLPDVSGSGELEVKRNIMEDVDILNVPPGGWQYPELPKHVSHLELQVKALVKAYNYLSKDEARAMIVKHNVERLPRFFDRTHIDSRFSRFRLAMQNHGYSTKA